MKRALVIILLAIVVHLPLIQSLPQHGDEKMYVWKAGYYISRLQARDFDLTRGDSYTDPGLSPNSFWAREQPFGSHLIYALAMGVTGTRPPEKAYSYTDTTLQGPESDIPADTLAVTRFAAVICTAVGLGLISYRFGWQGLAVSVILLLLPGNRDSFARAWAEGPLLLGFGLCAVTYGTRWFPVAAGATAAFKLTGLALWPLMLLPGSSGEWVSNTTLRRLIPFIIAVVVFALMTPVSWFSGGPLYLLMLVGYRVFKWVDQSIQQPTIGVVFFPVRYLWPIELGLLMLIFVLREQANKTISGLTNIRDRLTGLLSK